VLRAAQKSYKEIPSIFVVAENGCVGIDLCLPIILIKSIQRAAGHARFMDTWRKKILVKRWSGALMTGEFMLNRNLGGEPSLADQAIVLVGCGTIGSHLAKFLAQSGAGFNRDFILIDPDIYTPGNVGRHLLGPGSIGLPKADACRDELKRLFPHGRFRSVSDSVLSRLDTLEGATLVIDATGEEAVSIALNEILVKKGQDAPTAIFTWLAGAGAAAQAFLMSSDAAGSACLKCLHPDLHDARQYWPLKSVDCTDEVPPACGEAAFAPYGVAAPAIAAGLAIKLCMDWAKGQPEPRLRTIRVDLDKTIPIEDCNPKASQSCPACG
jgi:molybdopterin/thiamine biosynthesis adenylyltransferase